MNQWSEQFPMLSQTMNGKHLAYFDSASTTFKPKSVVAAMDHYLTHETSNVHRGIYHLSEHNTSQFEVVRDQIKNFINAAAREEVIFTRGTTESINLVANSFGRSRLKSGDIILLTEMEHHSNIVPWQIIAEQVGAVIQVIPVTENAELDQTRFAELLNPQVKLLALTMVSNTLGTVNPVQEMIQLARQKAPQITVLLDGAQAVSHFKVDVQELDCDFLAFSGHKLFGPTGVGVLWGKEKLLNDMPPWQGGGNMIDSVSFSGTTWNKLPEKFEAGTPAIAEVLGLGAAINFVEKTGYATIQKIDHELKSYMDNALKVLPHVINFSRAQNRIGIYALEVQGIHPQDLGTVLDKEGVAIRTGHHCTQPLLRRFGLTAVARASLSIYNTKEDIDQLVSAINKACRLFL